MDIFIILIAVTVSRINKCQNIIKLSVVQFIVCHFYLSKTAG